MSAQSLAPFTSVFRAGDSNRVKRSRTAFSCTACQRRKSKCDRGQPCGACEKRGDAGGCRFGPAGHSSVAPGRQEIQARLNKLEELVKVLAETPSLGANQSSTGNADTGGPRIQSTANAHNSPGQSEVTYRGPTSWSAIVESIHDIQDVLDAEGEKEADQEPSNIGLDIILGADKSVATENILDCLPARLDMDRLVQAYFNSKFVASSYIHTHHFRRRYESFLADPDSVSYLWISILFSVLCIGAFVASIKNPAGFPVSSVAEPAFYMAKASQCLVAGEYLKAKAFSVEALLLHAQCRNVINKDSDPTIWSLYGLAIRLAQRRGYHRSAAKISAKITPFEAEMRRRAWNMIQSADIMHSSQLGMPSMIHEDFCDVEPPTNLTDEDFDEDTLLPAPRPANDPSPVLAHIFKAQLCKVTRRIMHHVMAVVTPPYSETLALNVQLEECYASIPACLRHRPIRSTSFTDSNHIIMYRFVLHITYLKTLCVLHRPYLTVGKDNPMYRSSRDICRNAALSLLDLHIEANREFLEGGRLYEDRYVITSLACHDFLVAAMVVCLDLIESKDLSPDERMAHVKALEVEYSIWLSRCPESLDARHASSVLGAILKKASLVTSNGSDSCISPPQPNYEQLQMNGQVASRPELQCCFSDALLSNGSDNMASNSSEPLDWINIDDYLRNGPSETSSWQLPFGDI